MIKKRRQVRKSFIKTKMVSEKRKKQLDKKRVKFELEEKREYSRYLLEKQRLKNEDKQEKVLERQHWF